MTMPYTALAIAEYRFTTQAFEQVINHSRVYSPIDAIDAELLDEVVVADDLLNQARLKARKLAELNSSAFKQTKLRARKNLVRDIRLSAAKDFVNLIKLGIGRVFRKRLDSNIKANKG